MRGTLDSSAEISIRVRFEIVSRPDQITQTRSLDNSRPVHIANLAGIT